MPPKYHPSGGLKSKNHTTRVASNQESHYHKVVFDNKFVGRRAPQEARPKFRPRRYASSRMACVHIDATSISLRVCSLKSLSQCLRLPCSCKMGSYPVKSACVAIRPNYRCHQPPFFLVCVKRPRAVPNQHRQTSASTDGDDGAEETFEVMTPQIIARKTNPELDEPRAEVCIRHQTV